MEWDENINLNVSGNKSSPPNLQIVKDKPIFYVSNSRKYELPRGSIVYTTGFPGIDRVIVNPSDKTAEYFNKLEKEMTKEINAELVNDLLGQYFTDDIKRLETMIDRDLSVWSEKSNK